MRRTTRRGMLVTLLLGAGLIALPVTGTTAVANDEKIIISGASGRLGGLTVKELLSKGVPAKNLILVSRTPETLQEYKKLGAEVRFGDFAKPESLPAAYAGGTRMLLISIGRSAGPRPAAHKRAIDAAKAAGVKQIAYTSWIGVGRGETTGLSVDHLATEEILKKSGVAWTFLRNSIYMDNAVPEAAAMLRDGKASVPADELKVDFVTREDCAAAAAAVLTKPGHDNKAYDISGPEMIGVREIAVAATAVTGKAIAVTPAASTTPPASGAGSAAGTSKAGGSGSAAGNVPAATGTAVPALTGRPATSLRTFLAANKDRLAGNAQ